MNLDALLSYPQFSIPQNSKESILLEELGQLTNHHRLRCPEYDRVTSAFAPDFPCRLEDVPYLPVSLFKTHRLSSVSVADEFKILTSSGTTGSQVSQIVLDRDAAALQATALSNTMKTLLGPKRRPMIVLDTVNVIKDRSSYNARGAAILGMTQFGHHHFYALDDELGLRTEDLLAFLEQHADDEILIFGFTYLAWRSFLRPIRELGLLVDLSKATLIHSGGWKRLHEESVTNDEFKKAFHDATGLADCRNFYGMIEQIGSVFLEDREGWLCPPTFADVLIRDPFSLRVVPNGTPGVIQVLSALPRSYPGHSILTEDWGIVHGVREGSDGWSGKMLEVLGRVPKTELRGCSDVYAQRMNDAA